MSDPEVMYSVMNTSWIDRRREERREEEEGEEKGEERRKGEKRWLITGGTGCLNPHRQVWITAHKLASTNPVHTICFVVPEGDEVDDIGVLHFSQSCEDLNKTLLTTRNKGK